MKLIIQAMAISLFFIYSLFAEESPKIIVSGHTEQDYANTGDTVTVISNKEIINSGYRYLGDFLKRVPSVDIVQSGASGGNASVFIRGANAEHTLILLDGIELSNPASNARSFNIANLSLSGIEKIEIIRGPQASIYGSDAIGGVISIITKKQRENPFEASIEAGSFNSFREQASAAFGDKGLYFNFDIFREDNQGISAAKAKNAEDDEYQNLEVNTRTGAKINKQLKNDFLLRYQTSRADLDDFGGEFGDDPNRLLKNKTLFLKNDLSLNLFDNIWEQRFRFTYTDHRLKDNDNVDALHPIDFNRSYFKGDQLKFNWQHNLNLSDLLTLIAGIETEAEKADNFSKNISEFGEFESGFNQNARTNGYYTELLWSPREDLHFSGDLRLDDHSRFGSKATWKLASAYQVTDSNRLRANFGTAYKAPSLYQLYSDFGNNDLTPENSRGFDIGLEHDFHNATAGITYFKNKINNLINFDAGTFIFENFGEVSTEGLESFLKFKVSRSLNWQLNYSYTDTEDKNTGTSLLRRAKNKFSSIIDYTPLDSLLLSTEFDFIGTRFDNDFSTFPATRSKLPSYLFVNLNTRWQISSATALKLRVENFLDKEYEQVIGFGTKGIGVYGGVDFMF